MKKTLLVLILVLAILVVILILFKSCNQNNSGPLNLLPDQATTIIPDKVVIVNQIKAMARLETTSISFEKVIKAERGQEILFGIFGEKLTFIAFGEVVAGIDLSLINDDDIQITDAKSVKATLPRSEIFYTVIDNKKSYVVDRDTGLLAYVDHNLETQIRKEAQIQLQKDALDFGILIIADKNAQIFLKEFLNKLGFENIDFGEQPLDLIPKE